KGSLVKRSLLRTVDSFTYTGREFEYRKVPIEVVQEYMMGGEVKSYVVTLYMPGHLSAPVSQPVPAGYPEDEFSQIPDYRNRTDNRYHYPDVPKDAPVTCATHAFGKKDKEHDWDTILEYLKNGTIPAFPPPDPEKKTEDLRRSFIRASKRFI
ncbi:hypothetical protein H0H93_004076, partial [Arthromyces matolae]